MTHELTVSYTTESVFLSCTCKHFNAKVKTLDYFAAKVSHQEHVDAVNALERNGQ